MEQQFFFIKVNKPGDKRWVFLSDKGATSSLRIRAVRFSAERVQTVLTDLRRDNADLNFTKRSIS